jgi:uncharacterized membrane protein
MKEGIEEKHSIGALLLKTLLMTSLGVISVQGATTERVPVMEKCHGIALQGKNDCRNAVHKCANLSVRDDDPEDWNYVPTGECAKILLAKEQKEPAHE